MEMDTESLLISTMPNQNKYSGLLKNYSPKQLRWTVKEAI